jgi:crossover junction endodeoxyribonuclease RuvC
VEGEVGRPLRLVDVGTIRTPTSQDTATRLVHLETAIEAWLEEHRPNAVAVERVFARSDVSTVMGTAQASGIAMVCAARRGLPVALHTPSEVKAAITGSGRADKAQVGLMVTRILRLTEMPKPADAADALALAICHVWRGAGTARIDSALEQATAQAKRQQQAYAAQVKRARLVQRPPTSTTPAPRSTPTQKPAAGGRAVRNTP